MTEGGERGWQTQYEQSLDRESAARDIERATGLRGFFVDIKLWIAAVLVPFAFVAIGLGWVAERIGWARWVGVGVAAVATATTLGLMLMRRRVGRRGP